MTHSAPVVRSGFFALVAALGLGGCNTPPVVLEQANHTVQLLALADEQLAELKRSQEAAQAARLASLSRQKEGLLFVTERSTLDTRAALAAGDTVVEPFAKKMLAEADGLAREKAGTQAKQVAYASKLDALLTPLPSSRSSITQAQVKVAALGREMDGETRFKELQAFVTDLADSVKANKKKLSDAKDAAAKADAADETDSTKTAEATTGKPKAAAKK